MQPPIRPNHISTKLSLLAASLAALSAGCMSTLKHDMAGASTSPNPLTSTDGMGMMHVPIAVSRGGGMFRLVTATPSEVCVNGELSGDPTVVRDWNFVLQSWESPDENESAVPTAQSKGVNVLGSSQRMSAATNGPETVTSFQTCFPNDHILTADTKYLVVQRKPQPVLGMGQPIFAIWHFDNSIRTMQMPGAVRTMQLPGAVTNAQPDYRRP